MQESSDHDCGLCSGSISFLLKVSVVFLCENLHKFVVKRRWLFTILVALNTFVIFLTISSYDVVLLYFFN